MAISTNRIQVTATGLFGDSLKLIENSPTVSGIACLAERGGAKCAHAQKETSCSACLGLV